MSAAGSKSCDISRFRGTKTQKQQQKSVRFDVERLQSIAICRFYLRVCGCDKTTKIDAATADLVQNFGEINFPPQPNATGEPVSHDNGLNVKKVRVVKI